MLLRHSGYDAVHTLELPLLNRTPDELINSISMPEHRVVVTKDSDFVDTFVLKGEPLKLLLVSTGNVSNLELALLFEANMSKIAEGFESCDFIEITRSGVVFHG